MGIVIWGISVCIPAFMLGGIAASVSQLGAAITAILVASLILMVISLATGNIGAHTRMSTAMSSKFTFGRQGNILMAILMFIGTFAEVFAKVPEQAMPFGIIVSIIAGGYAVGAIIQPDITRYSKSKGHSATAMVFGMMIGFLLILILAAYLTGAAGISQFADVMLKYHRGAWGIFAMHSF